MDSVDFKYILNNNLVKDIVDALEDTDAVVFWQTFFKAQRACAADEFFENIRQLCEMNKIPDFYKAKEQEYEILMSKTVFDYVISIDDHKDLIVQTIKDFVSEALNQTGYCVLKHQVKMYMTQFEGTIYADAASLIDRYSFD